MDMQNPFVSPALLRLPQVLALIPISKSAWWQGCRDGRYPAPLKLSVRTTVWRLCDILALVASLGQPAGQIEKRGARHD